MTVVHSFFHFTATQWPEITFDSIVLWGAIFVGYRAGIKKGRVIEKRRSK